MPLIEHIIEPKRILMIWQALAGSANTLQPHASGTRFIVGEVVKQPDGRFALHYLQGADDYLKAVGQGFSGYPAFSLKQATYEDNVMDSLERRLPNKERADFGDYLSYHGIAPTTPI